MTTPGPVTQSRTETDLTKELERVMRERGLESAPEPDGSIPVTNEDGVAYGMSTVQSAGYTYLWNTFDLERSTFNNNAVMSKLRERFPADHPTMAGQYSWTSQEPKEKPWRGTATCPLHSSRPERAEYAARGYPACNREQLPNEFEAREHLRLKHPRTWRAMEDEKAAQAREEDRAFQRTVAERLAAAALPMTPGDAVAIGTPAPSIEVPVEAPDDGIPRDSRGRRKQQLTPEQEQVRREALDRGRATRNANLKAKREAAQQQPEETPLAFT